MFHFTVGNYLIMLSIKQGGNKYNFWSLWYDPTWNWTSVYRGISEHSTHNNNRLVYICKYICEHICLYELSFGYIYTLIYVCIYIRTYRHLPRPCILDRSLIQSMHQSGHFSDWLVFKLAWTSLIRLSKTAPLWQNSASHCFSLRPIELLPIII